MKHAYLFLVAFAFLMASCGQGDTEKTASLQRQVDSLTKLVPAGANAPHTSEAFAASGQNGPFETMAIGAYYMPTTTANTLIQNYHSLFVANGGAHQDAKIPSNNMKRSSFVIPRTTLQALIDADKSNCEYVVFYLGYDKDSKNIDLIYTGITPVSGSPGEFTEITYPDPNDPNQQMVFDNGWPCPNCDGIGVHAKLGGLSTAIYCSVGAHGKISPSGDIINIPYGHDASFTITPDNDHELDSLILDGQNVVSPANPFLIPKVKETHILSVKFKATR